MGLICDRFKNTKGDSDISSGGEAKTFLVGSCASMMVDMSGANTAGDPTPKSEILGMLDGSGVRNADGSPETSGTASVLGVDPVSTINAVDGKFMKSGSTG